MKLYTFVFYLFTCFLASKMLDIAYKSHPKRKTIIVLFVLLFLSLIAGLRYEVGADWYQYYHGPELVGKYGYLGNKNNYELGYIILCKLIYHLGLGGRTSLFVYAFLTEFFLIKTIDKYKNDIDVFFTMFSYMTLYYFVSFNITRQALAISIGMYAISCINIELDNTKLFGIVKKNSRYFVFTMLAFLFHRSALICLVALPLCLLMNKSKSIRNIIIILVIIVVANFRIFTDLAVKITGIGDFQWYFIVDFGDKGSFLLYFIKFAPILLTIWLCLLHINKNKRMEALYNLFLVGLIVNSLSLVTNTEIERISFYFLYFDIILLGFAIKNMSHEKRFLRIKIKLFAGFYPIYRYLVMITLVFNLWFVFFYKGSYKVVPYRIM